MDLDRLRLDVGLLRSLGRHPVSLRHVGLGGYVRLGVGARHGLGALLGDLGLDG